MKKEIDINEFEKDISQLRREYDKNPNLVANEVKSTIKRIKKIKKSKSNVFGDVELDKFLLCIVVILIVLTGLFTLNNPENIGIFFGGVIFFLAGIFVGLYEKYFGLIFLFSHGMTGLAFMEVGFLKDIVNTPKFLDNAISVYIYLGVTLLILIVATLLTILHNLSDNLKENKFFKLIPLSLYLVAFILSGLLNYIFDFIYAIHL